MVARILVVSAVVLSLSGCASVLSTAVGSLVSRYCAKPEGYREGVRAIVNDSLHGAAEIDIKCR